MNKKNIFIFTILIMLLFTGGVFSKESTNITPQPSIDFKEDTIYLYGLDTCPHCQKAKEFMEKINQEENVDYFYIELRESQANKQEFFIQQKRLDIQITTVPLIVINDNYWVGFDQQVEENIKEVLNNKKLINNSENTSIKKDNPGLINKLYDDKNPIFSTAIIGFIDGFNPCSLWVLTLLLSFLVHYKSKRKMFLVGITFLLTTALVYGLFIAGVLNGLSIINYTGYLNLILGAFVLLFGLINIKDYFYFKKGVSATISDKNKSKLIKKMRKLINNKKGMPLTLLFASLIAFIAALVELPCTSGFPVIWSNIMVENGINSQLSIYIPLILFYLFFYLLDELFVFGFAVKKLQVKKMDLTSGKKLKLIMGLIMFYTGIDILFNLNFVNTVKGLTIIIVISGLTYTVIRKIFKNKKEK